ncbi:hypothetical protein [Campylobacter sp. 19-13652]|uniref:hypothetical protein n=1 Tax=Campylobacter sp. 19-13652 TaxID=2840180 RepID=UPI001C857E9B|nr:hypothetical protein [Campylobacter sp. 19-13652]
MPIFTAIRSELLKIVPTLRSSGGHTLRYCHELVGVLGCWGERKGGNFVTRASLS